ncbi:hypothetical protein AWC38_SpisGene24267 [Stylophora pistillata]|uniref:DED domain-containing protein n=1 Tax=Stylophora pistillata TaxID=50429 RepID=A0A2B4R3Y5_STYPI|nr:hypothetical protein AWC38_SpisGene24267 [Stylophora pistillata]
MELSRKDLERLMFAVGDRLPRIVTENIDSGLKLFEALEEDVHIGPQDLALLHDGFQAIGRMDLARRIQFFPRKLHRTHETDDRQDDIVTDGVGHGSDPEQKESDLPYTGARTAAADKHAMTFRSEVVQPLLRSANAGIRSTSTSLKGGCHLDITIDGYDVGKWALRGGEEMSIERSVFEAKRFTFYRVKSAPKEAGIESGRPENGLVNNECEHASIGDYLKHELQHLMEVMQDPYQVLVLGDKVQLSNDTRIRDQELYYERNLLSATPSNHLPVKLICSPRPTVSVLIPEYIYITVEYKSGDTIYVYITVEYQSGDSIYIYITVEYRSGDSIYIYITVEYQSGDSIYIYITVEYQSGDSISLKIDKEKNLRELMEEVPSFRNPQEKEKATFVFNGKQLCPSKDKGTIASLGICSGSKLGMYFVMTSCRLKLRAATDVRPKKDKHKAQDGEDLEFSKGECKPLSTLTPPAVQAKNRANRMGVGPKSIF